jgi:hypothetical protein
MDSDSVGELPEVMQMLRGRFVTVLAVIAVLIMGTVVVLIGGNDQLEAWLAIAMPVTVALLALIKAEESAKNTKEMLNGTMDKKIRDGVRSVLEERDL